MLILLYIFLGLLIFDCLIACRLYSWKESSFKNYLKTVESTKSVKTAKENRTRGFIHQS
jgi:hypothetical protein